MGSFSYSHTPRCLPVSSGPCAGCASDTQYCIFPSKQLVFINFTSLPHNCPASCKIHYCAQLYSALTSRQLDPPAKDGIPTLARVLTNWKMIRKELQEGQSGWKTCLTLGGEGTGRKVTCLQRRSPCFARPVLVKDRYLDEQDSTQRRASGGNRHYDESDQK